MDPERCEVEPEPVDELARQREKRRAATPTPAAAPGPATVPGEVPPAPELTDGPSVVSNRLEELSTALRRYQAVAELEAMLLKD